MNKLLIALVLLCFGSTLTSEDPPVTSSSVGKEVVGPYCPYNNGTCQIPP